MSCYSYSFTITFEIQSLNVLLNLTRKDEDVEANLIY